jgi:hypothetical protein
MSIDMTRVEPGSTIPDIPKAESRPLHGIASWTNYPWWSNHYSGNLDDPGSDKVRRTYEDGVCPKLGPPTRPNPEKLTLVSEDYGPLILGPWLG